MVQGEKVRYRGGERPPPTTHRRRRAFHLTPLHVLFSVLWLVLQDLAASCPPTPSSGSLLFLHRYLYIILRYRLSDTITHIWTSHRTRHEQPTSQAQQTSVLLQQAPCPCQEGKPSDVSVPGLGSVVRVGRASVRRVTSPDSRRSGAPITPHLLTFSSGSASHTSPHIR